MSQDLEKKYENLLVKCKALQETVDSLAKGQAWVMLTIHGDPQAKEDSPDHYSKSILGRLTRGNRYFKELFSKQEELAERIESGLSEKFGWDTIFNWLKEERRWLKILIAAFLLGMGMDYAKMRGFFPRW